MKKLIHLKLKMKKLIHRKFKMIILNLMTQIIVQNWIHQQMKNQQQNLDFDRLVSRFSIIKKI